MCRDGVAVEMSFDHKPEDEVDLSKHRTLNIEYDILTLIDISCPSITP